MTNSPYKAVLFDLDGVLVSTDELHYVAWSKIAQTEGIPFDRTVNDRLRGVSRRESVEILLQASEKPYSEFQKECLATAKNALYQLSLDTLSPADLIPGAVTMLEQLRARGVKTAIGSSSKNTRFILDKLQITQLFDAISDGNGLQHSKPDPEVFLRAADLVATPPRDCLVVEDAISGFQAAAAANMDAAAIGPNTDSPLARYHLTSLADLLEL